MENLSIIVLSFNTKEVIDECLSKLKKAVNYSKKVLKNKIEVIVIDNNSSDGSVEMIGRKHSWISLKALKENTGFSKGNNIGMKESKYSFILLLNSDCYVNENILVDALKYFENNSDCSVLGCKLILPSGKPQISVGYLPNPINTIFWISGISKLFFIDKIVKPIHPNSISVIKQEAQVEWAMGAFFMLKRKVYEETGGMDENIFMYGEEVEWCKRIKDAGFKMFFVPKISATHLDKASSKGDLTKPLIAEFAGIKIYFKKHYRNWYPIISVIIKIFLIVRIIVFILIFDKQRVRAYQEALNVI